MAAKFILGRAGTGKTAHCFRALVDAALADPLGPPLYWLLPKQATFTAERELTCLSGLDAFLRIRVVSFDQFGRDVFEDCGGSSIPEVTALGRQMILGHLLRRNRPRLRFFSRVARQPGLAAELDATFAELERSGKSGAELGALIGELSESNAADLELAPLLDKLHDTRLLYDEYSKYLGQDRLDQHRRLTQVEASLSECSFLGHTTIYVDGFLEFTEYERRILAASARAGASLHVTMLMDPRSAVLANPHNLPDEMSLFRRTEETYRRLYFSLTEQNVPIEPPQILKSTGHLATPALAVLEAQLFEDGAGASTETSGIELIEAPGRRAEVDGVARRIGSLLREGFRLRDIGVLVRDLERYHGLIDSSFGEHSIPFFVDRRRTAGHHPLLQFLSSIFHIARNDWDHDAVMSLLHTGLAGVSLFDADGLENYVLGHRIRGAAGWEADEAWGYRKRLLLSEDDPDATREEPEQAEVIRRTLLQTLLPLITLLRSEAPIEVRETATEIFTTLDRFKVRQTLAGWIEESTEAANLEQAAEHEQVWANLVGLFEQLVDLLGGERMLPGEFFDVMEVGLDSFDLALTPPTVDQVLVGQADRTRGVRAKAVFVLGLNEGEFPRVPTDGSILTDRDRRTLRRRRIDLDPGLQERLLDERLLAYIALTRATARLFVSRPSAGDEGRPTEPSSFWRRIEALFPDATKTTLPGPGQLTPDDIATPRQLVTSLMRWVRGNPDPVATSAGTVWPALYQWLAQHTCCNDAIDEMRFRAWRALSYANTAGLSEAVSRELFTSPLRAGVAELETFAACPFKHFAKYTLGLRERAGLEVTSQDLGRIYHEVLEGALKETLRRRAQGDKTATLESAVDRFVDRVGGRVREELMLGSARNRYLLERARKTLQQISRSQREILRRGLFRPAHVGVSFGPDGTLPPLVVQTPGGAEVQLHGKIDRVDRVEGSGDAAVIDYRMGEQKLAVGMIHHGLALQLMTYMLVLQSNGVELSGKALDPAAAFYLQLLRKIEDVKHPKEALDPLDPKWHLKLKPRGIFDRRCLGALDKDLSTGRSEVVQVYVKQDGGFGFRGTSDAAETDEFRQLLGVASSKLGELTDGILSGKIDVAPYRLNNASPCPRCEFRGLCRFDPAVNRYNHLDRKTRDEVLEIAGGPND